MRSRCFIRLGRKSAMMALILAARLLSPELVLAEVGIKSSTGINSIMAEGYRELKATAKKTTELPVARIEATPELIEKLGQKDETKAAQAARLLVTRMNALSLLFEASMDAKNELKSERAAKVIEDMGIDALPFLISKLNDKNAGPNAVFMTGQILEHGYLPVKPTAEKEVISELDKKLKIWDPMQRNYAAVLLGKTKSERAAQPLVDALLNKNAKVAKAAEDALFELREKAVDRLAYALIGDNTELSKKAEGILIRIGKPAFEGLFAAYNRVVEKRNDDVRIFRAQKERVESDDNEIERYISQHEKIIFEGTKSDTDAGERGRLKERKDKDFDDLNEMQTEFTERYKKNIENLIKIIKVIAKIPGTVESSTKIFEEWLTNERFRHDRKNGNVFDIAYRVLLGVIFDTSQGSEMLGIVERLKKIKPHGEDGMQTQKDIMISLDLDVIRKGHEEANLTAESPKLDEKAIARFLKGI